MTAKEYLQQLQRLDIMINHKIQEKADLKASLTYLSSPNLSQERVQGGEPIRDARFTKKSIKLISLEQEIDETIDEFVDLKHKIIVQIHRLQNSNHSTLLYKRYVENKRLKDIATEMNYTYQYIRELHDCALKEFERSYTNLQ